MNLPANILALFASDGITAEVLETNRVTYEPSEHPATGAEIGTFEVDAVRFNYFRDGAHVGTHFRYQLDHWWWSPAFEPIFYGLDNMGSTTVITDTEMNKLAFNSAGWPAISVPSVPDPTNKNYDKQFDYLERCEAYLKKGNQFVLAFPRTAAGERIQEELARRLGRERCLRLEWPAHYDSATAVAMVAEGPTLPELVAAAKPWPIEGIFEVEDIEDQILSLYKHGMKPGVATGWPIMDEFYKVRPGEFTLITGIPGHGKSEWLDGLLVNLARYYGWRFAVCSPENQPIEQHFAKLAEKYIGRPFADVREKGALIGKMSMDELRESMTWARSHFTFVLPPDEQLNVEGILEKAKALVLRNGIKGLVIDPWNELDHLIGDAREDLYLSRSLGVLRRFGRRTGVHIFIIAHPKTLQKGKDGKYEPPRPYDISGGATWFNKADNCITVFRDVGAGNPLVEIYVQKIKFKINGRIGKVCLNYEKPTGRYNDPTDGQKVVF